MRNSRPLLDHIDCYYTEMNRFLGQADWMSGRIRGPIHHGRIEYVDLLSLGSRQNEFRATRQIMTYSMDDLAHLCKDQLNRVLCFEFDFGNIDIEVWDRKIAVSHITVSIRPDEKLPLARLLQRRPAFGAAR